MSRLRLPPTQRLAPILVLATLFAAGAAQALDAPQPDLEGAARASDTVRGGGADTAIPALADDTLRIDRSLRAPVSIPLTGAKENHPEIRFVCPEFEPENIVLNPNADYSVPGCPIRVYDLQWSFGSPDLAVHPTDHRQVAFFALHGLHQEDGPTERSRYDRPHTTFTSQNQGMNWQDQPNRHRYLYGEAASGAMDSNGNLYIGYVFSIDERDATRSAAHLYRAGTVFEESGVTRAYGSPYEIETKTETGWFTRFEVLRVDGRAPSDRALAVDPAPDENDTSDAPRPEHIVAVWHEQAGDPAAAPNEWAGWIDVASFVPGDPGWGRLDERQRIGPCSGMSNPVHHDGYVFVACTVAKGYDHRTGARVGDVDIWRIDALDGRIAGLPGPGNATFVDDTRLVGGHTNLAATGDGYMVLVAGNVTALGHYSAQMATSWYGKYWRSFELDLGRVLSDLAGSGPILDAHVTAMVVGEETKTALLVYKEWHDTPEPADIDPQNPQRLAAFKKVFLSFNECEGPLAAARLDLGTGMDMFHAEQYLTNPGGYNDLQDGLTMVREEDGAEIAYFAVNDYGSVQYGGAVFEGSYCPPPPAPIVPTIPGIPVAQALTTGSASLHYVGAGVGAVGLAMIGYLLAIKRRTASYTTAEDR